MTDYSIYDDCQTFADFNQKAKEQTAFGRIKSIVANSNVAASVKAYALQRNEIVKRNKAKKAELMHKRKINSCRIRRIDSGKVVIPLGKILNQIG